MLRWYSVLQLLERVLLQQLCLNGNGLRITRKSFPFPQMSFFHPHPSNFGVSVFCRQQSESYWSGTERKKSYFSSFFHGEQFCFVWFCFFLVGISNYAINKQVTHFCSRVARKTMRSLITRFSFPSRLSRGSWKARRARGASRAPSLFLSQKAMTAIPFFT